MALSDFDIVFREWRQLLPVSLFGIGTFVNKYVATLPFIRKLCLRNYVIGRSMRHAGLEGKGVSIIVPCKNEKGNIENIINRIPTFTDETEIIFIEGHSSDGTLHEINRIMELYPHKNIKVIEQTGIGKANATFSGTDTATNEIVMILDADLTVPPEQLIKFWDAIKNGKAEFINGSRMVYPMEHQAMRFLNVIANYIFSRIFTWLLNQRYTDTLCGIKVLSKQDFLKMKSRMNDFLEKDPFGDFYLIFGSTQCNLKMIEIPIMYTARVYGETQIHRFNHGWQLLMMVIYGYKRIKAF
jgi:glycosyltransferase involved in cell wall biosynthesis